MTQPEVSVDYHMLALAPRPGFRNETWVAGQPIELKTKKAGPGVGTLRCLLEWRPEELLVGPINCTALEDEIELVLPLLDDPGPGHVALWPFARDPSTQMQLADRLNGAVWKSAQDGPEKLRSFTGPLAPTMAGIIELPAWVFDKSLWGGPKAVFRIGWVHEALPEIFANPILLQRPSKGLEEDALAGTTDEVGEMTLDIPAELFASAEGIQIGSLSIRKKGEQLWGAGATLGSRSEEEVTWFLGASGRQISFSGLEPRVDYRVRISWTRPDGFSSRMPATLTHKLAELTPLRAPGEAPRKFETGTVVSLDDLRAAIGERRVFKGLVNLDLEAMTLSRSVVPSGGGGSRMQLTFSLPAEGRRGEARRAVTSDLRAAELLMERALDSLLPLETEPRVRIRKA